MHAPQRRWLGPLGISRRRLPRVVRALFGGVLGILALMLATTARGSTATPARELVFVDPRVGDVNALVADLRRLADRNLEIVVLDPAANGLEQVSARLAVDADVGRVHFMTHAAPGLLELGATRLDLATLRSAAAQIGAWAATSTLGEVFFYGCALARGSVGATWLRTFAELSGTAVAASTDDTGSPALGGDWELEAGSAPLSGALFARVPAMRWHGLLATATFQQGASGYAGAADTYLDANNPSTSYWNSTTIRADDDNPVAHGLVRFDNIFGNGAGQIPLGSTISSVTLRVYLAEESNNGTTDLHRMLVGFNSSSTWNSFVNGVSRNNVEASSTRDGFFTNTSGTGFRTFTGSGIATTVQAWSDGGTNHGWLIYLGEFDGIDVETSEFGTSSNRPLLTVDYTAPADLAVVKSVSSAAPNEGDAITYSVRLTNNGPANATGVVVTDLLPAGVTYQSYTTSQGTYANGTGLWSLGAINNGETDTLRVVVTVDAGTGGTLITNTASVTASDNQDNTPGNDSGNVGITVQLANLSLSKSVNSASPNEGQAITYTVVVSNAGPNAATNVQVTDAVPAGLTYQSHTVSEGSWVNGTGVWSVGTLSVSEVDTLRITATVNAGTGGTTIGNTASVTAVDQADHVPGNDTDNVDITVQRVDLSVVKTVDVASPNEGQAITYTVVVSNAGPNAATNVQVTDAVPAGLTYQSHTVSEGSWVNGTGVWSVGTLSVSEVDTLRITATVNAGTGGTTIGNTASVTAVDQADHVPGNDTDNVDITVQRVDLSVVKTVDVASPNEGQAITYTVVVSNAGPNAATNVQVTDAVPAGLTYQSHTVSEGSWVNGTGVWSVGTLSVSEVDTLRITATVNAGTGGTTIGNTASVTAVDQADHVPGNDTDNVDITVQRVDLSVVKTVDVASPNEGQAITYTVVVSNAGPNAATNVQVTDAVPVGLTYQSHTVSEGSWVNGTGVWSVGTLSVSEVDTLRITATVNAGTGGTTIGNTASVTAVDQADHVPGNDTDNVDITVQRVDLSVVKSVDAASPNEDQAITYTIVVSNTGPNAATGVEITDTLPTGLTYQLHTVSEGSWVNGTGVWSVGTLSVSEVDTLRITATVNTGTGGTTIGNTASVTAVDQADHVPGNDTDSVDITVQRVDLSVAKSVDVASPNEGQAVTYTVVVSNAGPNAATGVEITDTLPAGVTYQSATATQGGYVSGTGVWTLGSIGVAASDTLWITATVDAGTGGTTIGNTAGVTAVDQADHAAGNDTDSVDITVQRVDLAVAKSVDAAAPNEGQAVTYTVVVSNAGPNAATGVEITDTLPAGLTYQSHTVSEGSWVNGTGVWSVGTLSVSEVDTLRITATVNAGTGGTTIGNTASVTAVDQADHVPGNDTDSVDITVQRVDLSVVKSVDAASPNEDQAITYTIVVSNTGPNAATGVEITDTLPTGLTYQSHTVSEGSWVNGTGVWSVGTLSVSEVDTLRITATVDAGTGGTTIGNTASVTAVDQADHVPGTDTDSVDITVQRVDLSVVKSVDAASPNEDQAITYTIVVSNTGPNAAMSVEITDTLPAGVTYQSATATQGGYVSGTGVWTVGSVGVAASDTLWITATVDAGTGGTTIGNTASVTALDQADHVPGNDTDGVDITVQRVDLSVAKSVDVASPNEAQEITYTIVVGNAGPNAATGVEITDTLPAGVTYQAATATQGGYVSGTGVWTLGSIGVAASDTLWITATVDAGTGGTTIGNTASVTAVDQADHVPGNDTDSADITVQRVDLSVAKTVDVASPNEGQEITYTIVVGNAGPNAATGVEITDTLPAGVTYQSATATQGGYVSGTGVWTLGSIGVAASDTLWITATVDVGTGGTTIGNTAGVTAVDQADHVAGNDTDSADVTVQRVDVSVAKSVDVASPNEGQAITYTVVVGNAGPNAATGVEITDTLPAGVTYQSATATQGGYVSGTGVWTLGSIGVAASDTLWITAEVDAGTGGTTIANIAGVTALDQADHVAANDTDSVDITVQHVDLSVAKTVDDGAPNEGQEITYTVVVTNLGFDGATNVDVTDALPAGVTYQSATVTQGTYNDGTGVWTVASIASAASDTLWITAVVDAGSGGTTIGNTASVTAVDQADHVPGNDAAGADITVQRVDLAVSKSVDNPSPNEGQTITYRVVISNAGPSLATSVEVSDALPTGVTYQASTATQGSYDSGAGVWTIGSIAAAASDTLWITVEVDAGTGGTTISNTASVSGVDQADHTPGNDSDSVDIGTQNAELAVSKSVDDAAPNEGQAITYTVVVANSGPSATTGLELTDVLPSGVTYQSATVMQGSYDNGTGVWTLGGMAVGASDTLRITATVDAGTGGATIGNTAAVTAVDQADHVPGNDTAVAEITVQRVDLAVSKSVDDALPNEGQAITYAIVISNAGPNAATSVELTDTLPVGVTYQTATATQGSYDNGTGVWALGSLAVAGSDTLWVTVTVDAGTGGATIGNTASVTGADQADHVPGNDTASAGITVQRVDLAVAKSVDDASPNEGQAITYTVVVSNAGPNAATSVELVDVLPVGVSYQTATATQGSYDNGTGVWTLGGLAVASSDTLWISTSVDAGTGGATIGNTASVTAIDQADHVPANDTANADITVQRVDLAVSKSVSDASPNEGQAVTYAVVVSNTGPNAATNIELTDALPVGVTYQSATATQGSYDSGTGVWALGVLAAAGSDTLWITATVDTGTGGATIGNTASVTAVDQADHVPGNDTANADIMVQRVDLALTKSVDDAAPNEGQTVTYAIVISNAGPNAATGVELTDVLPVGVTFQSAAASQGSYNDGTGVWTLGSLAVAATDTLWITATVDASTGGTTIGNTASVTAVDQADHVPGNDTASVDVTVQRVDLAVSKSVDDASPNEGQAVTYAIVVSNTGPNAATSVELTDALPVGVTYQSAVATQGNYDDGTGVWTLGSLAAAGSDTLWITTTVDAGTGGTTIGNTASVTAVDQADHVPGNDAANADITVQRVDLVVSKSVGDASPNEGQAITYSVVVSNAGPNAATSVELTDALPVGVTYQSAVATQGGYDDGTGVWTLGSLAVGASDTLQITATVDAGTGGTTIGNTAGVTAVDQADHVPGNDTASADVTVQRVDLAVSKSVDDASPNEGQAITYTVVVSNAGPNAATSVELTDALPAGVTYQSAAATQGGYDDGTGVWTLGSLAPASSDTLWITATVDAGTGGTTIGNTAGVTAVDQADHVPGNDTASADVTVQRVDLAVSKSVDDASPNEGQAITYTVVVSNAGPNAATSVELTDALPAGVTYQSAAATQGGYDDGTGVWTLGSLAVGASDTLQITATVDAGTGGTTIGNTAGVTAVDQADHVPGNDTASADVTVQRVDLAVSKSVDDASPNEGQAITYTVVVSNAGPNAATSVELTDALPAGVTYQSAAATQGGYDDGTGVWTLGSLAPASSDTLWITTTVDAGTGGATIGNTASVTAVDQADHVPGNDTASADITVQRVDLAVSKSVDDASPNEGQAITYTVVVSNAGPNAATSVELTDALPAGVTYQSAAATQGSYDNGTGVWTLGSLATAGSDTLQITVTVDAGTGGTTIGNTAGVTAVDQADHVPGNDTASVDISVLRVDLAVSKSVDDASPNEGQAVTYAIVVSNAGPNAATSVELTDALPVGVTYQSAAATQGNYDSGTGVWALGSLAVAGSDTLWITATVDAGTGGTTIGNTANVTAIDQADHVPANNTAGVDIVVQRVDLAVSKSVDDTQPREGAGLRYQVIVVNNSGGQATNVVVRDLLPVSLSYAAHTTSQGTYDSGTGLWSVGTIAAGAADTLFVDAHVNAGTAETTITNTASIASADQADHVPGNDAASVDVAVASRIVRIRASQPESHAVRPAGTREAVYRVNIYNQVSLAETLTAMVITNTTAGPGTQAQLDASWQELSLHRADTGAELGRATFSFGTAQFQNLGLAIAAVDSVALEVRGAASLIARDSDALDVALNAATAVSFTRSLLVQPIGTLAPTPSYVVDGMVAAQVRLTPVAGTNLTTGSVRNLVFSAVLPANGYTLDVLESINVKNLGSALDAADIARVEAWVDDGDGVFEFNQDRLLGPLLFTGNRWERTGVATNVPAAGVRVFVSADIASTAAEGRTVRMALVEDSDDRAVGMASGNDGPIDQDVANPFEQAVSNANRVTLTTVSIDDAVVHPGDESVAVLAIAASNSYSTTREITRLAVTNVTQTVTTSTVSQRDGEYQQLYLHRDGNGNGQFDGAIQDPLMATTVFVNGKAAFTGLTWQLLSGASGHVFVVAELSRTGAADGDVLGVRIEGGHDFTFDQPTAVAATWPLDSGARMTVDGMVAAQVNVTTVPSTTLGPNDGPVVAIDVRVPTNGYVADVLEGLEVVNLGSASRTDLADIRLWRDGGDGVFTPVGGDDVELSQLVWLGSSWKSLPITQPVTGAGTRLFVGVTIASAPSDSVTIQLAVPVNGITMTSNNDGPLDLAVANPERLLVSPAPLLASLHVDPVASTRGDTLRVTMNVRNTGTETVLGVAPSAINWIGDAGLTLLSGPLPASIDLSMAASTTFTWTYRADAVGMAQFFGNAMGVGETTQLSRRSLTASSSPHHVFEPAGELRMIPVGSTSFTVHQGQTDVVPLSLTFLHPAGASVADILLRSIRVRFENSSGAGIVPSALLSRIALSEGTTAYLNLTTLPSSGAEVDLDLATPIAVTSAEPVTIALRLDIAAATAVPEFRVTIEQASWLDAVDGVNANMVPVTLQTGTYPVRSGLGRLHATPSEVRVAAPVPAEQRVAQGQQSVQLLSVTLTNPGTPNFTSNVRVGALQVRLVGPGGVGIATPAQYLDRVSVEGAVLHADKNVTGLDSELMNLVFAEPVILAANAPAVITIRGDIAMDASVGTFQLQLGDPATLDARDVNNGASISANYEANPTTGDAIVVQHVAQSVALRGTPMFPSALQVGALSTAALTITARHPGAGDVGDIAIDAITLLCRDEARNGLVPSLYLDRIRVLHDGTEVGFISSAPSSGSHVVVPIAGVALAPGETTTLRVEIDVEPTAPPTFLELLVDAAGFESHDANAGTAVAASAEAGNELPLTSGLTKLESPPTRLVAGLDDEMPAMLAADGVLQQIATLQLTNPDVDVTGSIRITGLTLRASDAGFIQIPIGAAAVRLHAYRGGQLWASSDSLTVDSLTATLIPVQPIDLGTGASAALVIRAEFRQPAAVQSLRVGIDATSVDVTQPSSALLRVRIQAPQGESYPIWTRAGQFSDMSLNESFVNFPNPFAAGRGTTTFTYYLSEQADVSLRILTLRGEPVVTLMHETALPSGLHQDRIWNGKNGTGVAVANGVYLAELVVEFMDGSRQRVFRKVGVVR